MSSPWLAIPLADYERHMALAEVAQAQLLADVFAELLDTYRPQSVAVLGCAGGNGFERISAAVTKRVVGVDLNPAYIEALRARFHEQLPGLELIAGDIQSDVTTFAPVELVYAGLILEYVDVALVLGRVRSLLVPPGILGTVIQLPGAHANLVTPSSFASLQSLESCMRLVSPTDLTDMAAAAGYKQIGGRRLESGGRKQFQLQVFQRDQLQQ